jgi:hypothetical protein
MCFYMTVPNKKQPLSTVWTENNHVGVCDWRLSTMLVCSQWTQTKTSHLTQSNIPSSPQGKQCLKKQASLVPTDSHFSKTNGSWSLVAQTYNLSYSGGRDQKNYSLKPAWANSSWNPILKKLITKKDWWSGSRYRPVFKPQYQ